MLVNVAAEPVVFWFSVGNVQFVNVPDVGVPSMGVTNVGLVDKTTEPEPVELVTPVPPAAAGKVPAARTEADVEYRAALAAEKVVKPVPP